MRDKHSKWYRYVLRRHKLVRSKVGGRQQLLPRGLLQAVAVLDDKVGEGDRDQKRRSQSRREVASSTARASSSGRGSWWRGHASSSSPRKILLEHIKKFKCSYLIRFVVVIIGSCHNLIWIDCATCSENANRNYGNWFLMSFLLFLLSCTWRLWPICKSVREI